MHIFLQNVMEEPFALQTSQKLAGVQVAAVENGYMTFRSIQYHVSRCEPPGRGRIRGRKQILLVWRRAGPFKGPRGPLKEPGALLKEPGVVLKDPCPSKGSRVLLKDPGIRSKGPRFLLKDLGAL